MNKCEALFNLYKESPKISNAEAAKLLGMDEDVLKSKKYRLKKRGFIDSFDGGVIVLKPKYTGPNCDPDDGELQDWKKDAYHELFAACMDKLRENSCSSAQFISLVQESRLILKEI